LQRALREKVFPALQNILHRKNADRDSNATQAQSSAFERR